tara:strand:+ start:4502 stop:5629 length:1128 start_codon:yes stop_codon:yes gene_type:complete
MNQLIFNLIYIKNFYLYKLIMNSYLYTKNFKLKNLFEKFSKINYNLINQELNLIQKTKKFLPNLYQIFENKYKISDNLFKISRNINNNIHYKTDKNYISRNLIKKSNNNLVEKISINENKDSAPYKNKPVNTYRNIFRNINTNTSTNKSTNTNINTNINTNNCNNKIFNQISKNSNSEIKFIDKKGDYLSNAYFNSLSSKFYILSDFEKVEKLKEIKIFIINKFVKENFYKHFHYTSKYFKKSDLDNVLMNNLPLTDYMLKVYSDIFNTNTILIEKEGKIKYISTFIPNRTTVVIYNDESQVFFLNNKSFIRGSDISNYLPKFNYIEEQLNSKKLDELYNIAKSKNTQLKKKGKNDLINCKKSEIIYNILNNVLN